MATKPISTKIELTGEKEYKAAVSEINSGLRVLKSEMELVSAQFEENADSVEALTKKNDVLERQILTQRDKVEQLREALENAAQQYGEADKRTQNWQVQLNKAETELTKLNGSLDKNKAALENARDSQDRLGDKTDSLMEKTGGLGDSLDKLAGKFGIDLPDSMKESLNGLGGIDATALKVVGSLGGIAVAVKEVEDALIDLTKTQAEEAGKMLDEAAKYGLTAEEYQMIEYAARMAGSSIDDLGAVFPKLTKAITEANEGNKKYAAALTAVGVTQADIYGPDGNLKSALDLFYLVAEGLSEVTGETERDALAQQLLGKSYQDLKVLYRDNLSEFKRFAQEYTDAGWGLTDAQAQQLAELDDAYERQREQLKSAKNDIALEFEPFLRDFVDLNGETFKELGEDLADSGVISFFGQILELLTALLPLLSALGYVLDALSPIFDTASVALGLIADTVTIITTGIAGIVSFLGGGDSSKYWNKLFGTSFWDTATGQALAGFGRHNAAGDFSFPGGLTWVGENGPELAALPEGTRIYTAQESTAMARGDTFNINVNAADIRELADLLDLLENLRRLRRMGGAKA